MNLISENIYDIITNSIKIAYFWQENFFISKINNFNAIEGKLVTFL